MPSTRALAVTSIGACLALVILLYHGHLIPAAIAKLIASTAFIALALHAGALQSVYGKLILAGLAFSWCGDMLLIGTSKVHFLAGLVAFLLAHLTYIFAFAKHGYDRRWAALAAAPLIAIAIAVSIWLKPFTPADLSIPVLAYIGAITVMVILAIATRGVGGSRLIVAGAVMFFLSDLSVAALRLVETEYATYILGLPLYYAGQACLALSVSQSRSH